MKKTKRIESLKETAQQLVDELKHFEEKGQDEYRRAVNAVAPIFSSIKFAIEEMDLAPDQKRLSIPGAMHMARDKHLLEYINQVSDVKRFILNYELSSHDPNHHQWKQAFRSVVDLESYANDELFERVQLYSSEIKKLSGGSK